MPNNDMLIKLYDLEFNSDFTDQQAKQGVVIRKPIGPDQLLILSWAKQQFPTLWVGEIQRALNNSPCSCFVAQRDSLLLGIACYDATALGYFGPVGVVENSRSLGIGRCLTMACLNDMRLKGYGYAVVGMADNADFYRSIANAIEIPDSSPGIYKSTMDLKH